VKIKFILISVILLILVLVFFNFFILDYSKVKITGKATGPCIVNGVCDASFGEDSINCPEDCGSGGSSGGSGGGIVVSSGVIEDIPLGKAIANSTTFGFDWSFDDADIETLKDTQINFQGKDYDIHEELILSKTTPAVETSLTGSDDDYESNVFLETISKGIKYYYAFDDAINVSKATTNEPLTINFLGKDIKIINVDSNNKFTALVGSEYFMNVGDTVTVSGKSIILQNVGEGGSVLVSVGGVQGNIPAKTVVVVNGISIYNIETYYTNEISERSAVLNIGDATLVTYQDGDAYIGEDENDPDWEWVIHGLAESAATTVNVTPAEFPSSYPTGPVIGIKNAFTKDDDTDFPPGTGSCYNLPNNYVSICLDSLTVPDNDYLEVTTKYNPSVDTAKSGHLEGRTSVKVIEITAPGTSRFNLGGHLTSQIWLQVFTNGEIGIFYNDPNQNPSVQFFNSFSFATKTDIASVEFGDTSGNNVKIKGQVDGSFFDISVEMLGDSISELREGEDNLVSKWLVTNGEFVSLGNTNSLGEIDELQWTTLDESFSGANLGIKNEDHRTKYGIIIKNPALNGASDQVVLLIPSDQVQGNIKITGYTTLISSHTLDNYPKPFILNGILQQMSIVVGAMAPASDTLSVVQIVTRLQSDVGDPTLSISTRLDSEVTDVNQHIISVGSKVNNQITKKIYTECSMNGPGIGLGKISICDYNGFAHLVVDGYEDVDIRKAAKILSSYDQYSLYGTEVCIGGDLTQPTIIPCSPPQTQCEPGCSLNNVCVPVGYRNLAEQGASYCGGVLWGPQKANGETCQNNFECLSNFCSNNKCVDLVSDIQSNTGILNQMLFFLQSK